MPDFASISASLDAIAAGSLIVVVDDDSETATGALAGAAQFMDTEKLVWLSRRVTGLIGVPMSVDRADELELDLMVAEDEATGRGAFTVSVDLVDGNTSPADQARTIAALARAEVAADDFARPGHVFPLRAREGGVLKRAGHAEAVVDLCRLAGLSPVGVVADLVSATGDMMPLYDAAAFAADNDLLLVSIADVVRHRRKSEILVEQMGVARVPTKHGDFMCHAYRSVLDGVDHIAFVMGDVDGGDPPLVRVHSECLTGDILGSLRCDCGPQLDLALQKIAHEGRGVLIYLRGHEGRGIGIGHKMRAYALQDQGLDTVEANAAQGLPVDSREYGVGANMLADLGVSRFRIMTNNPAKLTGLDGYGLEIVDRVPVEIASNPENEKYLETKRTRMGHALSEAPDTEVD
jgi:3,4-dihydroxy 2-butanone 4-phosphate synthase/GTP cyclohydrolase II